MYGQEPPPPECTVIELIDEKEDALAGFAVRSQYRMWFKPDKSGPVLDLMVLRPRFSAKKPRPILFLNSHGNHEMVPDEDVIIPENMWYGLYSPEHRVPTVRGVQGDPNQNSVVPVGMLLSAGFAIVSPKTAFVFSRKAASSSSLVQSGSTNVTSIPILASVTEIRLKVPP